MEVEVAQSLDAEQHFWTGVDNVVTGPSDTYELIDDALRSYLEFTAEHKKDFLLSEYDVARCCYKLLDAPLFQVNQEYVRRQFLYCLLQEDEADTLHLVAAVLLYDGRTNDTAFEMMQCEGAFPRLVELVRDRRDDDIGLYRLLLELLFEMSRIQKLGREDLVTVDDNFILYLLQLIEQLSDDADDPYHYPVIRVLLALNEQYMCLASAPILSTFGPSYRTFGENLILLLNREAALAPQLLILKLLYLLFTTPSTYEYFYTNDLHVLVDVIIRNLLDLDPGVSRVDDDRDGHRALRHTYLRVLCPLLKNTQLAREGNNYKREEVRRLLFLLVNRSTAHFAPVDETVIRLVIRCKQIAWLRDEGDEQDQEMDRKLAQVAPKDTDVANKLLGMSIGEGGESSLSVVEVAAKVTKEKPSVPAPRRRKKKHAQTADQNGSQNGGLKPPPVDMSASFSSEEAREGDRSPFADDNETI
ncbi:hypothetical protein KC343_g9699 [Hortaea werneckii]|nr:hypothetical protein KC338_g3736 [Hortaea werneckii]KAI6875155.1 hypothetical protein KC323_g349 [Hortaea werneckii]KAI7356676.1 hypothetical protein KC320_g2113 [Hortaea werneckii]KAI7616638.1 hypothetical protein KC343_g9699 [Hortaea werneckii]